MLNIMKGSKIDLLSKNQNERTSQICTAKLSFHGGDIKNHPFSIDDLDVELLTKWKDSLQTSSVPLKNGIKVNF